MESTRQRIHRTLLDAEHPMTTADLAVVIGMHRTVVAQHLRSLVSEDLVRPVPLAPSGRGRPSTAFVAIDPQPYRTLARWLAHQAAAGGSARDAGRQVGRQLLPRDADTDIVDAIEREAMRLGFAPERHERDQRIELVLQHCPYADIAAADLGVVCELHRGLVEGMAELDGRVAVDGLRIGDPHRGGCRVQLRRVG